MNVYIFFMQLSIVKILVLKDYWNLVFITCSTFLESVRTLYEYRVLAVINNCTSQWLTAVKDYCSLLSQNSYGDGKSWFSAPCSHSVPGILSGTRLVPCCSATFCHVTSKISSRGKKEQYLGWNISLYQTWQWCALYPPVFLWPELIYVPVTL